MYSIFPLTAVSVLGNVYITDTDSQSIRTITISTGIISHFAGTTTGGGGYNGDGGAASSTYLYYPQGIVIDSSDNIYFADKGNGIIRKITVSTNIISKIAGTAYGTGFSGDGGAATSAKLSSPSGVAVDTLGNIYIADTNNHRIRKVAVSTNIITTIAGTGTSSYTGDDIAATSSALNSPYSVAVDAAGIVYIADYNNHRIRMVTGVITTIVGTGASSYSGDNVAATSAQLNRPRGVAIDSSGNVYIADQYNQRIRKVTVSTTYSPSMAPSAIPTVVPSEVPSAVPTPRTESPSRTPTKLPTDSPSVRPTIAPTPVPTAIPSFSPTYYPSVSPNVLFTITTLAGTGATSYSGDGGDATSATFNNPCTIGLDASDNVYITDYSNGRIRKVTVSTGKITTIAGTGAVYSGANVNGNGAAATSAVLNNPLGVAVDSSGMPVNTNVQCIVYFLLLLFPS